MNYSLIDNQRFIMTRKHSTKAIVKKSLSVYNAGRVIIEIKSILDR